VAFTADAGRKWTANWPSWDSYAAFWSQVIRWSLRPVDRGNLTLAPAREEGRIKVVVDALDKEDQFLNFLQIRGTVVKPDLTRESVELAQVAPGRYEGAIAGAEARGNYFVSLGYLGPDGNQGLLQTGVSVPYSDEYRELQSDPGTLATLASVTDGQVFSWKADRDGSPDIPRTAAGPTSSAAMPSRPPRAASRTSGRSCSGWPPCSSSATSPSAASPPTSIASARRWPPSG
jgi:hypothetical protein